MVLWIGISTVDFRFWELALREVIAMEVALL
jgi:hypothetical protein